MKHVALLFIVSLGLVACPPAVAQNDMADVTIKSTHVSGQVYMLEGRGGNIGVSVGEDGILIVDDQYAPLAEKIKIALGKLSKGKLEFVLNTHWHGDHTGGNAFFGREGKIIAHSNVLKRLSTPQQLFNRTVEPLPKEGLPVVTFDDSLTIRFNGEQIRVQHFPHGHTDGDSIIFFPKSNVVHMGDHYFNGMFPFVDLDHGGDVEGMARNIKAVIDQTTDEIQFIAGHGPIGSRSDLKNYHQMLLDSIDVVRRAKALGKSLDEIKTDGVPDRWKSWGNGFIKTDRWLETVYRSLG